LLGKSGIIWDIGFFINPHNSIQFIEINAYTEKKFIISSYLKEYQNLLTFLHNSKGDLATLLGFRHKDRVERDNDILISKDKIKASLDKYGLELKNPDHLFESAHVGDGLYSFKELERKFISIQPPFKFIDGNTTSDEEEDEYLVGDEEEIEDN